MLQNLCRFLSLKNPGSLGQDSWVTLRFGISASLTNIQELPNDTTLMLVNYQLSAFFKENCPEHPRTFTPTVIFHIPLVSRGNQHRRRASWAWHEMWTLDPVAGSAEQKDGDISWLPTGIRVSAIFRCKTFFILSGGGCFFVVGALVLEAPGCRVDIYADSNYHQCIKNITSSILIKKNRQTSPNSWAPPPSPIWP